MPSHVADGITVAIDAIAFRDEREISSVGDYHPVLVERSERRALAPGDWMRGSLSSNGVDFKRSRPPYGILWQTPPPCCGMACRIDDVRNVLVVAPCHGCSRCLNDEPERVRDRAFLRLAIADQTRSDRQSRGVCARASLSAIRSRIGLVELPQGEEPGPVRCPLRALGTPRRASCSAYRR